MAHGPLEERRVSFVEALQKLVRGDAHRDLDKELRAALEKSFDRSLLTPVSVRATSDDSDKGTLRVLEPTPSVAVATIDPAIPAQSVEFYLTRPSGGGGAETRRLGVARYRDSDHNWRIRFVTDRFADTPQDAVVVHAEVIGVGGQLLAVAGSGGIC